MVLGCERRVGAKAASGEEKRTELSVCFLASVVCEVDHFFFWMSIEVDQGDGCLVLEAEVEGGGRLGLLKELEGSVACSLSPTPVPSVVFPLPISMGSSEMDNSGT